jgi:arylsulfatase A-like enzyme
VCTQTINEGKNDMYLLNKMKKIQRHAGRRMFLIMLGMALTSGLVSSTSAATTTTLSHTKQDRPNIVFMMADDHTCNTISAYGSRLIQTPNIDRIADQGMKFNQAMVSNSICSPSRATLLTGKYSHKNGVRKLRENFNGAQQTFPKLLQKSGYQTAIIGKWHLKSVPTGFDHFSVMIGQGQYNNCKFNEKGPDDKVHSVETKGYVTDVITDKSLTWLKQRSPDKPFCLMIHHKAPHGPHDPAPRHRSLFENDTLPEPPTLLDNYEGRAPAAIADSLNWSRLLLCDRPYPQYRKVGMQRTGDRDKDTRMMYQAFMKGYLRLIATLDENVGRVLDYLEESGLSENTIVIYASDNGFFNGEHGFYNKMWMYEPSLKIPLLIRGPDIKAKSESKEFACIMDVAPTLLDYAGCNIPEDMQGQTIRPLLEGRDGALRDVFYYHHYGSAPRGIAPSEIIGICTRTHKLIYYPKSKVAPVTWELFDLIKDPQEMHNLYSNPKYKQLQTPLKKKLYAMIVKYGDTATIEPSITNEN